MSTTSTLSDPIVTLESDLTVFATPQKTGSAGTPGDWKSTSAATPGTLLTTAGIALGILRNVGPVANALDTLGTTLSSALGVAADVLNAVGDTIAGVAAGANTPTEITDAIATLQETIATVQSSLPGGAPIFAAGDQFITSLTTYLQNSLTGATSDLDAAASAAYQMAQQFRAVGAALGG
jgi:hypothetical protein